MPIPLLPYSFEWSQQLDWPASLLSHLEGVYLRIIHDHNVFRKAWGILWSKCGWLYNYTAVERIFSTGCYPDRIGLLDNSFLGMHCTPNTEANVSIRVNFGNIETCPFVLYYYGLTQSIMVLPSSAPLGKFSWELS